MIIKIEGEEIELPNDITKEEIAHIFSEMAGLELGRQARVVEEDKGEPITINVNMPSGKKHVKVNRSGEVIDSLDVTEQ